ncbi:PREDICTED: sulfated surface glycoprotein 185-like [Nicotiana attenuata]|uniref:Prolamin-like domain-containing protein n=1 Tax=Nicotiana attenuata TaxID=49451 RepID=A0A314KJK8_NICAT|nr:PREDICTED: sulfated surface glycoprotein 185-like [Nicotiana attenuata]OIT29453.1 hypothetical protein A4A49_16835 [Nicotiana attenuata]
MPRVITFINMKVIFVLCILTVIKPSIGRVVVGVQGFGPGFSGGLGNTGPFAWSFGGPEAEKCVAALKNTPGCIQEIFGSLFIPFHFHSIGPQCCKAVIDIQDNCWPKIFPISPLFPFTLKNFCTKTQGQVPVAQQPPSPPPPFPYSFPLPSSPTSSPPPPQPFSWSFSFGENAHNENSY